MVVHTCDSSTSEAEAGESQFGGQLELHCETWYPKKMGVGVVEDSGRVDCMKKARQGGVGFA